MYCSKCGRDIGEAAVCPYCSDTFENKAPETEVSAQQPTQQYYQQPTQQPYQQPAQPYQQPAQPYYQQPTQQPYQQQPPQQIVYVTAPPAPTPPPAERGRANPFAIIGFILSFTFILSPVSLPLSILGIVFAGIKYKGRGRGLAIAGTVLSGISLLIIASLASA